MDKENSKHVNIEIPKGFIVFISGVPGVGKTTISYELLRSFDVFRIIKETDLVREVLRGYNEYIKSKFKDKVNFIFDEIEITDHKKLLSFSEATNQCYLMRKSIEKIVDRQQRRGIPSIINGVHIIPEALNGLLENRNTIYINLYVNNKQELIDRLRNRDINSYMLDHIPFIFRANTDLYISTSKLASDNNSIFHNVDVTNLSIKETVEEVTRRIKICLEL